MIVVDEVTPPDRAVAVEAVMDLLRAVGQDPHRAEIGQTPFRVVDFLCDMLSGSTRDPLAALGGAAHSGYDDTGELVGVRDILFRSLCEHHLLPFEGRADIYYLPGHRITGIARLADVVEIVSHRLQLQERLGQEIADAVLVGLDAIGVAVSIEARHSCNHRRGSAVQSAPVLTLATAGQVPDYVRTLAALRGRDRRSEQ